MITTAVQGWGGLPNTNWEGVFRDNLPLDLHKITGKLYEPTNAVKAFFTATVMVYSAPYFFTGQAIAHAFQAGKLYKESTQEKEKVKEAKFAEAKKLFIQALKEAGFAGTLYFSNWLFSYWWLGIPNLVLIGKTAYDPLQFRVDLNRVEQFLMGEDKQALGPIELGKLGPLELLKGIMENNVRFSTVFGMSPVTLQKAKEK